MKRFVLSLVCLLVMSRIFANDTTRVKAYCYCTYNFTSDIVRYINFGDAKYLSAYLVGDQMVSLIDADDTLTGVLNTKQSIIFLNSFFGNIEKDAAINIKFYDDRSLNAYVIFDDERDLVIYFDRMCRVHKISMRV